MQKLVIGKWDDRSIHPQWNGGGSCQDTVLACV